MRILQVHKYLYPRDGASTYLFALVDLLVKHGHEVGLWGTSESNAPQPPLKLRGGAGGVMRFNDLLVEPLNFDRREGIVKDLKKFGHMIWSYDAARKFEQALTEFKPDIIHIHNIYHHISPSILAVAKKHHVPVVATVHDYHLINPNYTLYDHGAICERDGLRAIFHKCIKNSYLASVADVIETKIHRAIGAYKNVARFIAPAEFVKNKLVEKGMGGRKIEVVPLPVTPSPGLRPPSPIKGEGIQQNSPPSVGGVRGGGMDYILYAGRLTQEKGIYLLLEIAKQLPEIKFKIAGIGPEEKNLALQVTRYKLHNVELLGFVEKEKLQQIIVRARIIVVPSLWYEPSPYAVLEAMAQGKAVIASRIGGIEDLIEDGETGVLVAPPTLPPPTSGGGLRGGGWVDTIKKLWHDEALLKKIGKAAQEWVLRAHNPEKHYEKIMEIYGRVIRY